MGSGGEGLRFVQCCFNCAYGGMDTALGVVLGDMKECGRKKVLVLPDFCCEHWARHPELSIDETIEVRPGIEVRPLHFSQRSSPGQHGGCGGSASRHDQPEANQLPGGPGDM
jgi:hypothetical protein